ncbi:uncharacterized protein LOC132793167 [Drosophila nasuta]|uniref:uncharacterized protein LOC132793167 n=1 Tax=Drosophila nasuta TaxID=42062 RepID=UPI00295E22BD|nr:uncharacterized protein LOC132793167 [Drosophila nasuta]
MHFSPHFVCSDVVYSTPMSPFSHRYQTYCQEEVKADVKPSVSFYIHCENARQEHYPRYVVNYRRKFCERSAKLKRQAVEERRQLFLNDRVECLKQQGERVRQVVADYHAKHMENWLRTREHLASDMEEHRQRRERHLIERLETLRRHNEQVKSRCELLRYGNYLRRIARQHEVRRKRRSIF